AAGELAGQLGARSVALERDDPSVFRQRARHPDRAVAAERPDLEHAARTDRREEQLKEPAELGRDVDLGQAPAPDLGPEFAQEVVFRCEETLDVRAQSGRVGGRTARGVVHESSAAASRRTPSSSADSEAAKERRTKRSSPNAEPGTSATPARSRTKRQNATESVTSPR